MRGSALVGVLLVLLLFMSFTTLLIGAGKNRIDAVQLSERNVRALNLAESALSRALFELGRGEDLDSEAGVGNVRGTHGGGAFSAAATNYGQRIRIRAEGEYHGVVRTTEIVVSAPTDTVTGAITAQSDVILHSPTFVDAYDSRLGTYASQLHTEGGYTFAAFGGHVQANGSVSLSNAELHGDIRAGPGQEIDADEDSYVAGATEILASQIAIELPPESSFQGAHENNGNQASWDDLGGVSYDHVTKSLTVSGGNQLTLTAGTYFFTSITLSGGSQILADTRDGRVEIFVTGNVAASGGAIYNPYGEPPDVRLNLHPYATESDPAPPSTPEITLTGGSGCKMLVYAPAADIRVSGSGEMWGALVGNRVEIQGCVHYDKALSAGSDGNGDYARYECIAFRELGR